MDAHHLDSCEWRYSWSCLAKTVEVDDDWSLDQEELHKLMENWQRFLEFCLKCSWGNLVNLEGKEIGILGNVNSVRVFYD